MADDKPEHPMASKLIEVRELGLGGEVIIRKLAGGSYNARLAGNPFPDGGGSTPDIAVRGLLAGIDDVRSKIAATVPGGKPTPTEDELMRYIDDAKRAAGDERLGGEPLDRFIARMLEELRQLRSHRSDRDRNSKVLHAVLVVVDMMEVNETTSDPVLFKASMPSLSSLFQDDEDRISLKVAVRRALDD